MQRAKETPSTRICIIGCVGLGGVEVGGGGRGWGGGGGREG